MKCPHCSESIGLFSKELNRFKKNKSCPHCKKPIRVTVDIKIAALLIIPAIALAFFLKPFFIHFGLSGAFGTALPAILATMLSMRIKPA